MVSLKEDFQNLFNPERLKLLRSNSDISEKLMTLSGLIVTIKDAYEDQAKKASVSSFFCQMEDILIYSYIDSGCYMNFAHIFNKKSFFCRV